MCVGVRKEVGKTKLAQVRFLEVCCSRHASFSDTQMRSCPLTNQSSVRFDVISIKYAI